MTQYIAKQSIGQFKPGQKIEGLSESQLQDLLKIGAIEEEQSLDDSDLNDDSSEALAELTAKIAELNAENLQLKDLNEQSATKIAELNAEIAKLNDVIASSKSKSSKDKAQPSAPTDSTPTETK